MEVMVFMGCSLAGCKGIAASCVRLLPSPAMRSVYDQRRDNLRALMTQWGGPTSMAKKLGHSNGSYVAQLAGPNPSREISEKVAREMEAKLGLPIGWSTPATAASWTKRRCRPACGQSLLRSVTQISSQIPTRMRIWSAWPMNTPSSPAGSTNPSSSNS